MARTRWQAWFGIWACMTLAVLAPAQADRAAAEAQVKLATARMQREGSDLSEAVAGFRKATELDRTYAQPWFYLGAIAEKQGEYEVALGHFEQFCKLDQTSEYFVQAQLKMDACKSAIAAQKTPEGRAQLDASRRAAAAAAQASRKLEEAAAARAAGLRGKAARLYGEAFRLSPRDAATGLQAAEALLAAEESLEAAKALRAVLRLAESAEAGSTDKAALPKARELFAQVAAVAQQEHGRLVGEVRGQLAGQARGEPAGALAQVQAAQELSPGLLADETLVAALHARAGRVAELEALLLRVVQRSDFAPQAMADGLAGWARLDAKRLLGADPLRATLIDALGRPDYELLVQPLQVELDPALHMVFISPGRFQMGGSGGRLSEEPVHAVSLSHGFWIGRYEVTQAEWEGVMGSNPSHFAAGADAPRRPVESVSWNDAMSYCAKLTSRESAAGRLPSGYKIRLPTEAEWEYCCRAGTTTRFSFGDEAGMLGRHGWYLGNSGRQTHAVGGLSPNSWGLYDMHGNVWEWCLDAYGDYPSGSVSDPYQASGPDRVLRGGSWGNFPNDHCQAACRGRKEPDYADRYSGLRVVCAPVRRK
jgi:formylglycine-generating enzyme required for sulfatase activity